MVKLFPKNRISRPLFGAFSFAVPLLVMLASLAAAQDTCPEAHRCLVGGGSYRIVLPDDLKPGERVGAIVFFHGWQSSADDVVADRALLAVAASLRVALVAPDGKGKTWSFPGSPGQHRDEFQFVGAMLDDLMHQPVDPRRLLAAGFSQGGSMVWWLACRMPRRFAGFAPIAGAFWQPLPASCNGPPPHLLHVHGTADATVPMAGRQLRAGFRQGDVRQSFATIAPSCPLSSMTTQDTTLTCARASSCGETQIALCLHAGGHDMDPSWLARAWRLLPGLAAR